MKTSRKAVAALLAAFAIAAAQAPWVSAQVPSSFTSPPDNYGGAVNYGTYVESTGPNNPLASVPYSNYLESIAAAPAPAYTGPQSAPGYAASGFGSYPNVSYPNVGYPNAVNWVTSAPPSYAPSPYPAAVSTASQDCTLPGVGSGWVVSGASFSGLVC